MSTYIILHTFTDQGIRNIRDTTKRADAVRDLAKKLGVQVRDIYWTLGNVDIVGIFDAPEPWGPWTTAYFTERWDVGPGETCSLPTKWMSADGKTVYLVFSGDDHFAVRRASLTVE